MFNPAGHTLHKPITQVTCLKPYCTITVSSLVQVPPTHYAIFFLNWLEETTAPTRKQRLILCILYIQLKLKRRKNRLMSGTDVCYCWSRQLLVSYKHQFVVIPQFRHIDMLFACTRRFWALYLFQFLSKIGPEGSDFFVTVSRLALLSISLTKWTISTYALSWKILLLYSLELIRHKHS